MSSATLDSLTTFGDLLRHLRRRARLTQRELGVAVGYSEAHIGRLENNERWPDLAVVRTRFGAALNLEHEPKLAARLIELATAARGSGESPHDVIRAAEQEPPQPKPTNLPAQLTSFVGREQEIAALRARLKTTRLLTLIGAGGVGKTRLALRVASEVLADYPDGAWWVEFAPLADPTLVSHSVATALGVSEAPGRPIFEVLTDYLRSKRLLLALDNCEHLIEACARLADALLRACPSLTLLATSREALNVDGEVLYRVPTLSCPDPQRLPPVEKLLEFEAVHLFVDRAGVVAPEFRVTTQNAGALAQVCHRLDGIPLAIELAAARSSLLPVEQIASRLDDRFHLLTGGRRTAQPRHKTLHALIDWSYYLLTAAEQMLLRRLSVFAGGWTTEAAEAVCSTSHIDPSSITQPFSFDVLDLLSHLVDKSLVVVDRQPGGAIRYRLLDTIRQYGLERLAESGEAAAIRQHHAHFFLALVEETEPKLGGVQLAEWWQRLEMELDNLRAVLAWSQAEPAGRELGLRLVGALDWFWGRHLSEGRGWLECALAQTALLGRTPARAKALCSAGTVAQGLGDLAAAQAHLEESAVIWREVGDKQGLAHALIWLAELAHDRGDFARMRPLVEEGLALSRQVGDKWGIAWSLNNLGGAAGVQGDSAAARALHEQALTLFRELDNGQGMSIALYGLGAAMEEQGDYAAARSLFEQALSIVTQLDDKLNVAMDLNSLGIVALRQGDYCQALAFFTDSLTLARQLGFKQLIPHCLAGLAGVIGAQGQLERAARLCGAIEAQCEAIGVPLQPRQRPTFESDVVALRTQLGEAAFSAAWIEGAAVTLEQAVEYALAAGLLVQAR